MRYFEAGHKCTTIHHLGGKTLTKESLLSFERSFGNHVLRCRRSILVATRWIEAMARTSKEKHVLRLRGMDTPVAVSRRGAREVRRLLEHEKGVREFITGGRFGVRRVWAGDGIEMTTQSSEATGL